MLNPTGDPQLNHEPHDRQFLCVRSYQSTCSSFVILDIALTPYVDNESRMQCLPVNSYSSRLRAVRWSGLNNKNNYSKIDIYCKTLYNIIPMKFERKPELFLALLAAASFGGMAVHGAQLGDEMNNIFPEPEIEL